MRLLVSGGAGFIGSHYVRGVLEGRYGGPAATAVTVLDNLTYAGNLANLPVEHPRLCFIRGDISDARLLADVVPGHDLVVNFAAESHVDRSLADATAFMTTNVLGTQVLLEACRRARVPRIVQVSTDEVYGSISRGSWTERSPIQPNSPYAASKAAADLIAHAYVRSHGLSVSITRSSNTYGPYQFPEKLIPLFVTNLIDGRPVPLYGDGHHVREWLHVDDHCRAIHLVLAAGRPGEVYNVAGEAALTNRELTGRLLDLCGAGWDQVRQVPDRKGHDERYALDGSKIRDELGFVPRVEFTDGLAEVVSWYRGNRWWWQPLRHPAAAPAPTR